MHLDNERWAISGVEHFSETVQHLELVALDVDLDESETESSAGSRIELMELTDTARGFDASFSGSNAPQRRRSAALPEFPVGAGYRSSRPSPRTRRHRQGQDVVNRVQLQIGAKTAVCRLLRFEGIDPAKRPDELRRKQREIADVRSGIHADIAGRQQASECRSDVRFPDARTRKQSTGHV